jgi:hypothetical protein
VSEDQPRLRFTVPGAAGVHTDAAGTSRLLPLAEVEGLLGLEDDALVLQYRVRDRAVAYDSGVQELRVPLEGVEALDVRRRWLRSARVLLRVRDLRLLETVPGARGGTLVLRLGRGDVAAALDLASTVALRAVERTLGTGGGSGRRLGPPSD